MYALLDQLIHNMTKLQNIQDVPIFRGQKKIHFGPNFSIGSKKFYHGLISIGRLHIELYKTYKFSMENHREKNSFTEHTFTVLYLLTVYV